MSRLQLTYLINKIDYGGAEIGMVRLLSGLDPGVFDVTAVTLKAANPDLTSELPDFVELEQLNLHSSISLGALCSLRRRIAESDILVCSLFPSIVVGSILGTVSRVPRIYVWRHNTTKIGRLRTVSNVLSIRLSDGVLTDSESTHELVRSWPTGDIPVTVLPLSGIELATFPIVEHRETAGTVRIGTVGRLVDQKGYPELIECAKRCPEYEFHVVGDGPLADELERAPPNVTAHGFVDQDELDRLWESFDLYFQPSRYEGLCITAIEAMACGLPVVASDVDGLSESIVDRETGYLVSQGDIDEYCDRLDALANDAERRAQFGAAGRERVKSEYSMTALADEFQQVVTN